MITPGGEARFVGQMVRESVRERYVAEFNLKQLGLLTFLQGRRKRMRWMTGSLGNAEAKRMIVWNHLRYCFHDLKTKTRSRSLHGAPRPHDQGRDRTWDSGRSGIPRC